MNSDQKLTRVHNLPFYIIFSISILAMPAVAEPAIDLQRILELPGHRALARTRAKASLGRFTTDGCSGGMSASWDLAARLFPGFQVVHKTAPPWEYCCISHDWVYHRGGPDPDPAQSYLMRLQADEDLRDCVRGSASSQLDDLSIAYQLDPETIQSGFAVIADTMFQAVRAGGGPCTGLPWRWGYGYPNCIATLQDFISGPDDETDDPNAR